MGSVLLVGAGRRCNSIVDRDLLDMMRLLLAPCSLDPCIPKAREHRVLLGGGVGSATNVQGIIIV